MGSTRVVIRLGIAAMIVGAGTFLLPSAFDSSGASFPARAAATYPDGNLVSTFSSVGEMVATAAFVFKGEVLSVEQGDRVRLPDGSGAEIVPRIIVVEVQELLNSRDPGSTEPSIMRITDGYWEDGVGYARESIGWALPGQIGFFLVSRDRAPDGTLMSTYSPLSGTGIALIENERVIFAKDGVWASLGDGATPAEFRRVLDKGVSAAQSGAAKPVLATICYPSVPGDENSDPTCIEE